MSTPSIVHPPSQQQQQGDDSSAPPAASFDTTGQMSGRESMGGSSRRVSTDSVASTRSSASQHFFRKLLTKRNDDYRSDAPTPSSQPQQAAQQQAVSSRSLGSRLASSRSGGAYSASPAAENQSRRCCSRSRCSNNNNNNWTSDDRRRLFTKCLWSRYWKTVLILFTFFLLFGAQIRFLCIPKAGDLAVDVVFMVVFCFFWLDIFMRIDVEPNYFNFHLPGQSKIPSYRIEAGPENSMTSGTGRGFCGTTARLGSFLFWCEVASTLALLYEISFVTPSHFEREYMWVELNQYYIPAGGLSSINKAVPIELEVPLLVTIAKTLRCARFIRSSRAIKISSRVNWYYLLNLLNPLWWWDRCLLSARERRLALSSERERRRVSTTTIGSLGVSSESVGDGSSAIDGGRKSAWGSVGLGALAAVKAQEKGGKQDENRVSSFGNRVLRFFGVKQQSDEEWRRELAAIKIQRAWRRVAASKHVGDDDDDDVYNSDDRDAHDVAWKGRPSSMNPMERALQKRSLLHDYRSNNASAFRVPSGKSVATERDDTGGPTRSRIPLGVSHAAKRRNESQVGSAMRELTGQRVAIGIIVALVLTVLFSYTENDATRPSTMVVLHTQTAFPDFANKSLNAARSSSIPDLYNYTSLNNETKFWTQSWDLQAEGKNEDSQDLREREKLVINVTDYYGNTTLGWFAYRKERQEQALVSLLSTLFILLIWFFGVTAFAGPVMILVVIPIERMIRLLTMLMLDPLGYQSTSRYKRFVAEEDEITKNTRWTKEILKGMETSFLMSTILRIGSLMKVGFGSAGVEIIRNNLEKGQSKNMLILSSQGSTVSCIFLFCDIRQFTDATECLQEEVFVFTNRIAAVVHSFCHSYGGSANKNIGDAFLLSWLLDEEVTSMTTVHGAAGTKGDTFTAKSNQADKALLSVVKICMALHHDDFYIEPMSDAAREALLAKLAGRKGPVVQLGFGLHAGKAVQGAIGSQRKIDATYVSEAVERAEFLESSTKKYGVKMLMSDSFHRLLHPINRRRCRKIDQILIRDEEDESDEDYLSGDIMELLTFDMDIDALWRDTGNQQGGDSGRDTESDRSDIPMVSSMRDVLRSQSGGRQVSSGAIGMMKGARRRSTRGLKDVGADDASEGFNAGTAGNSHGDQADGDGGGPPELTLPTGPALYNANVWVSDDMRKIRELYSDGIFFQKFNSGLQSFYAKDWDHARQCFVTILERFEDGPSRYFLTQIEKNNGKPPRDFLGYGTA